MAIISVFKAPAGADYRVVSRSAQDAGPSAF